MADVNEPVPQTSYSDPIYDRLETVSQRIVRHWMLIVGLIVVAVVAAALVRLTAQRNPEAASANRYVQMIDAADDQAKREQALATLAADTTLMPAYRAKASLELAQIKLQKDLASEAKTLVDQAIEQAKAAQDPDLSLAALLSRAALAVNAKDYEGALRDYESVERDAGGKYPGRQLSATLGAATMLHQLDRTADAIARLEPLITRKDDNGRGLLDQARLQYWLYKRHLAFDKNPPSESAAPSPASSMPGIPPEFMPPAADPSPAVSVPIPMAPVVPVPASDPATPAPADAK